MSPSLTNNDVVIAYTENSGSQFAFANLKVGDMVVFEGATTRVLHRIIAVEYNDKHEVIFALTKGDNNCGVLGYNDFVTPSNYLGKVGMHYDYKGAESDELHMTYITSNYEVNEAFAQDNVQRDC
jgi:hypothetical protein